MDSIPNPTIGRRALLRNGGIVIGFGAIVAACGGDDRTGSDDPGRLGVAAPLPTLPDGEVNDGVWLRTMQSLEYTLIAMYEMANELDGFTADEQTLVDRFVEDHERHAADLSALIGRAGAEPFECANPFLMERAVDPTFAALDGTDDLDRDLMNIAFAYESMVGASYQALIGALTDPSLRSDPMVIGGEEQRHAAALAAMINTETFINPVLLGEAPVDTDEDGFPVPYAIPATFGQLTGINLVVGARDDEGARFSIQLQTPADNTFVYDYLDC